MKPWMLITCALILVNVYLGMLTFRKIRMPKIALQPFEVTRAYILVFLGAVIALFFFVEHLVSADLAHMLFGCFGVIVFFSLLSILLWMVIGVRVARGRKR